VLQDPLDIQTSNVSKCVKCLQSSVAAAYILATYIPAFRFGSLSTIQAVTVSINPAENQDTSCRLPLLSDYKRNVRSELNDLDLADIKLRNDRYYVNCNKHSYFRSLSSLVTAINPGWTYESQKVSHIDVVACVTRPVWSSIDDQRVKNLLMESCHEHFTNTLRLLPSACWILCNGGTALNTIINLGGNITASATVGKCQISIGTFAFEKRKFDFAGWNRPAHKLYSDNPVDIGLGVKRLMGGGGSAPVRTGNIANLSLDELLRGLVFKNQRDLMRFLVSKFGRDEDLVCGAYALAERQGKISRHQNKYNLSSEQYAHALYRDGVRKLWF
jgi:hypothetical protein